MNQTIPQREKFSDILGWAAYLGCSWTWCIGMFLPVLLVRDFGNLAFWIFAIPNVVGAAAMGWVLRSTSQSRQMVDDNKLACFVFSAITICFHLFFLNWFVLGRLLSPSWSLVIWLLPITFCVLSFLRIDLPLSVIVLMCTLLLFAAFKYFDPAIPWIGSPPNESKAFWLAPVSVFGFALCPYLDPTFHHARQANSEQGSKLSFSVGFGLFFLLMILFTLAYAPDLSSLLTLRPVPAIEKWRTIVAAHIVIQSSFTIGLHLSRMNGLFDLRTDHPESKAFFGVFALIAGVSLTLGFSTRSFQQLLNMDQGELIYRSFMVFYGLVFPAYVWLFIVPIRGKRTIQVKSNWLILGFAILLTLPFYWISFIQGKMEWASVGVCIILLSRIGVRTQTVGVTSMIEITHE